MRICSFGEFLYDCFGKDQVPGGAPFNFSVHLARLGAEVDFCTALGRDELGERALHLMEEEGLSTALCQRNDLPTGLCRVTLMNGMPHYELVYPAAWDHIACPETHKNYDALYFGSLAMRDKVSREGLLHFLKAHPKTLRFSDLNLREPYTERSVLLFCLQEANILKLSDEEATALAFLGPIYDQADPEGFLAGLARLFPNLTRILLTLGAEGALSYDCKRQELLVSEKPRKCNAISTVGAGDSFSAAWLHAFLSGESPETCLKKAVCLSAYVVTQMGATPPYPPELKRILGIGQFNESK